VKRYILPFDVWDKRLDKIVRVIGKSRKEGKKWGGEVSEKEMRRLVISGNHYIRQGYHGFRIQKIAKLWQDETGKKGICNLFIVPF
jgi:hypothetical protein